MLDPYDDTTDDERLARLDRLEKTRRAERRFDPWMIAYARRENRRIRYQNSAIWVIIFAAVYALWRWF